VNKTARIQTVSSATNRSLYNLLIAFKVRTGYGVLCNTSLNFNGRGFINKIDDLSSYIIKHNLDGFVVEGRSYILKSSRRYQAYLSMLIPIAGGNVPPPRAMKELDFGKFLHNYVLFCGCVFCLDAGNPLFDVG